MAHIGVGYAYLDSIRACTWYAKSVFQSDSSWMSSFYCLTVASKSP
jgi:hypothetical protein